ncbi:MAG: hypothetical protein P4L28_07360 [Paludibacteraceae bacterium]|nr:hypothetical protein [Paludibacteraceae bacterium]
MPFIKISTLLNSLDKAAIMKNIENKLYNCDYQKDKLMPPNMATCIWQTNDCVVHKLESHTQFDPKQEEIPVFVDLYVNTQFKSDQVAIIMQVIAEELSNDTGIDIKWVFIQVHIGLPGYVFINGNVFTGKL